AYQRFRWTLGYRQPPGGAPPSRAGVSPGRQNLTGRKRLRGVTRLLLAVLPRWVQGALGFPVSKNIGRTLSPEIRASPNKPCGKGNKRKQDELDDDDDEDPHTWVEALSQELCDEGTEEDPDYEPSTVETESEEYRSHNSTDSDPELPVTVDIPDVNPAESSAE
ncbi:oogenesis-related, partial [Brachionichthys hirsutus]|uniref:oogenesis-related n=1 Tax=Brachionichthys hirsutus TaxID=412623 RepID=UPI003605409F